MKSGVYNGYKVHLIESVSELEYIKSNISPAIKIGVDTETEGLDYTLHSVVGVCLSCGKSYSQADYQGFYVPIRHVGYNNNLPVEEVIRFVQWIVNYFSTVWWNRPFDFTMLEKDGFVCPYVGKTHDAQCMAHLIKGESFPALKVYAKNLLKFDVLEYSSNAAEEGNFATTDPTVSFVYAAQDPIITALLGRKIWAEYPYIRKVYLLDNKVGEAMRNFMRDALIYLDKDFLQGMLDKNLSELAAIKREIFSLVGYEFKLNSNRDKADALSRFVTLTKKTAKGAFAVNEEALSEIDHPLAKLLIKYAELEKFRGTYLEKMLKFPNPFHVNYQLCNVPCLPASARVVIKTKGLCSISEVAEGDEIWTQYGWKKVLWSHKHWCDEIWKLEARHGLEVECSKNHLFLINQSSKRSVKPLWNAAYTSVARQHLILNSHPISGVCSGVNIPSVPTKGRHSVIFPQRMTPRLARMLGFLDGDGSLVGDGVKLCFNSYEPELEDRYCSLFESLFNVSRPPRYEGSDHCVQYKYCSVDLVEWLKSVNCRQKLYDGVSKYILSADEECWKEYIAGLWDTDGSIGKCNDYYQGLVCSVHRGFMSDVQVMCQFLGMEPSLYIKGRRDQNPRWQVHITSAKSRDYFSREFSHRLWCNKKAERSLEMLRRGEGYYDIAEDMVESSLPVGRADWVYDIEVEDVHEYVANGFVTHNTGRYSSGTSKGNSYFAPINIQNIPKVEEYKYVIPDETLGWKLSTSPEGAVGKMKCKSGMRDAFPCPEGFVWFSADYAAQEMRLAANFSREPGLIEPLLKGEDIHKYVAMKMFEHYDPSHRTIAKIINFASMYGAGGYTIGQRLGVSTEKGEEFLKRYYDSLPVLSRWKDEMMKDARRKGFVFTYFGRPRALYQYYNGDAKQRAYADRSAVNSVVQGTGGDLCRLLHVKLWSRILSDPEFRENTRYIHTVHDEVNFFVKPAYLKKAADIIMDAMYFKPSNFAVPIEASPSVGYSWGTQIEYDSISEDGKIILNDYVGKSVSELQAKFRAENPDLFV